MKTKISGRTDKESFEQVRFGQLVDVARDVDLPTRDGNGTPEAEELVQVEGRHLRVVPLEVGKVEMVGEGLLQKSQWKYYKNVY